MENNSCEPINPTSPNPPGKYIYPYMPGSDYDYIDDNFINVFIHPNNCNVDAKNLNIIKRDENFKRHVKDYHEKIGEFNQNHNESIVEPIEDLILEIEEDIKRIDGPYYKYTQVNPESIYEPGVYSYPYISRIPNLVIDETFINVFIDEYNRNIRATYLDTIIKNENFKNLVTRYKEAKQNVFDNNGRVIGDNDSIRKYYDLLLSIENKIEELNTNPPPLTSDGGKKRRTKRRKRRRNKKTKRRN